MPKTWDDSTFLTRLAAFRERPTPTEAEALADEADERALPALVAASTDVMEGDEGAVYRAALRRLSGAVDLGRWLAGDLEARRVAAHCLDARLVAHVPLIRAALHDSDDQVRSIARRSLRAWRASPELHALFVDLLRHDDPRVRQIAAEGVAKIGGHADAGALAAAVEAEADERTRDRLAWALEVVEDAP